MKPLIATLILAAMACQDLDPIPVPDPIEVYITGKTQSVAVINGDTVATEPGYFHKWLEGYREDVVGIACDCDADVYVENEPWWSGGINGFEIIEIRR